MMYYNKTIHPAKDGCKSLPTSCGERRDFGRQGSVFLWARFDIKPPRARGPDPVFFGGTRKAQWSTQGLQDLCNEKPAPEMDPQLPQPLLMEAHGAHGEETSRARAAGVVSGRGRGESLISELAPAGF